MPATPDAAPDATLVFVDTETTSLRPDRRAWEIALIVRRPGEADAEHAWIVDVDDIDLGNADPFALRIGRFYDRHPEVNGTDDGWREVISEDAALTTVEGLTRGAHLVGAVPNFDAEVLGARMRAHGLLPSWHYHLIDVETLAVGWLNARRSLLGTGDPPSLPWDSEALSRELGVEPAGPEARHTALGDARWARDLYDAIVAPVKVGAP